MMAWKVVVRSITLVAAVCCLAGLSAGRASAQGAAVAVSPGDLSFGVPVSSPQVFVSAQQFVTVAITGSGSATFSSVVPSGPNAGDFTVTSNSCVGKFTPPSSCQVGITFTSTEAAGLLETATLTISSTGSPDGLRVALNGALGAFQLFPALNTGNSLFAGVTWDNNASPGNPVNTSSVALSCPANPTARLSSTPDGFGNVFQDNTIRVTNVITSPASTVTTLNVCYGGDPNFGQFTGFPAGTTNCFQAPYEGAVTGFLGDNPDVTVIGEGEGATPFLNVYGVQPLDLMSPPTVDDSDSPIFPAVLVPGAQTLKVELLDAGGFLGSSTVHLVTNCIASGVTTGGTVTAPPLDPNSPGSLIPTFPFNNTNGQHIQFAANYLNGEGTTTFTANTVPQVADTAIVPSAFPAMVQGTSAGPGVCMRFNGELDSNGNPQCKAFTITCTQGTSAAAGVNCPQSQARNILFKTAFDSPDTPTSQSQIAPGTGPGFLMGTDIWNGPCSFIDPNLIGQPCPQDVLTSFIGGDPSPGGTTRSTNSTFVAVLNMPLPSTDTDVLSENFFGWQQSTNVRVRFQASPAKYPVAANKNPLPANGFSAAPIQSVTFGTNSAVPPNLPLDPTFPIAGDVILPNGTCPSVTTAGTFTQTQNLNTDTATGNPFAEGRYNLHYFATDCASTEELRFTFNANPTANWAFFKTVQIRIDHTAPSITATNVVFTGSPRSNVPNTVSVTLKCVDPVLAGDGTPGAGVVICGPALFFAPASTPSFRVTIPVGKTTHGSFQLPTIDLAGNFRFVTINY